MFSNRAISFSHLLRLPEEWQEGPYCGFYAMSIAMLILKAIGKIGWAAPPRARNVLPEHSKGIASLAYVARKYNGYLGGGWIFDISIMPGILERVGCYSTLYHFKEYSFFMDTLITSLKHGFPVIIPYDMGTSSEVVGFFKGGKAHFGVAVGYRQNPETHAYSVELIDGHGNQQWALLALLFQSNQQLKYSGLCTVLRFPKKDGDVHHPEVTRICRPKAGEMTGAQSVSYMEEGMPCDKLRGRMVIVYGAPTPFLGAGRLSVKSSPGVAPK